jgi:hypothetical protein
MVPAAIAMRQRSLSEETAKAWGLGVNGSITWEEPKSPQQRR